MGFTFSKQEHLCRQSDIKAVFKKGNKYDYKGSSLFVLPNGLLRNRFLSTFQRGYGSAVVRNKSRRISKEVYRRMKDRLKGGYDFILIVFSLNNGFHFRERQLEGLFKKAGILKLSDIK